LLAQAYITRYRLDDVPCRFDVVEVVRRNNNPEFNLIVNAFDGNDI
jgi:Holliday junction resolvase-like predicted endonuclease